MPQTTEQIDRVQHWTTLGFRMHTAKQIYSQNWEEYERVFKMFTDSRTGEDEWRASLPDTWSYSTIKTAQAAFIDSRITPIITQHEDEDKLKAEDMRDLYTDISDKGGMERELYLVR